jgi:tetratricopeptide (TPR) repeat protein
MRLKTLIWIIFMMGLLNTVVSQSTDLDYLFEQANQLYANHQYSDAAEIYQSILNRGFENGPLYYNLGNVYYRLEKIGLAVLYYEKALKWMPNQNDVRTNLQLANMMTQDKIDAPPVFFLFRWHASFIGLNSFRGWLFWMSLAGLVVVLSLVLRIFINPRWGKVIANTVFSLSLTFILFCAEPAWQRYRTEYHHDYGIILAESAVSHAAPQQQSTELFTIHEGTKIRVLNEDSGWIEIELIDGKRGWIPEETIGLI